MFLDKEKLLFILVCKDNKGHTMNPLIFKELKKILKNKGITVTVVENESCKECYIVEDIYGAEVISYTHSNIDKNIYELRVLKETVVNWVNPAKSTPEMRMLMEIVDLIKQRDQEQAVLMKMTVSEKTMLHNLRCINSRTK